MEIPVIFEDNHLLTVVKPPNVLSQGDKSGDRDLLTLLKEKIKIRDNKPGNVFRLVTPAGQAGGELWFLPKLQRLPPGCQPKSGKGNLGKPIWL